MSVEKRLNNAGFAKAATWNTSVNCAAAGCGITPMEKSGLKLNMPALEVDDPVNANETDIDFANINPTDFTRSFLYQYNGLENMLLALLMGTAGAPAQQGGTTAYLHTLVMANSVAGLFGTWAEDVGAKIHTVPGVKVMKATFSYDNGRLKVAFSLRGSQVVDNDATVTTFASITYPSIHTRAKAYQGIFRINAQTGADFNAGGSDNVKPKSWQLELTRTFDSEHESSSQTIMEPLETGKFNVKLTFDFARMDAVNAAYFADWKAGTEKKCDITFTGALIASTYYHYLKFQFPRLIIEDVEYASGNIIPAKVVFRAVVADAAPTGMTGLTKPVTITVMNTRSTDYLA